MKRYRSNRPLSNKQTMRTNTQVPLSFSRDELMLLHLLDEGRKKTGHSRSGWVKQKIREDFCQSPVTTG